MRPIALTVFVLVLLCPPCAFAQTLAADCVQLEECRNRALEARENRQYERFHDLAWRAVQSASPNDPDAMYLLARAQALSGRRRDALIMLRRLADMGVATDAAAEEDLRRVRELPGWSAIEARFEQLRAEAAKAPVSTAAAEPSVSAAGVAAPPAAAASAVAPTLSGAASSAPSSPVPSPALSPRAPAVAPSSGAPSPAAAAARGVAETPGAPSSPPPAAAPSAAAVAASASPAPASPASASAAGPSAVTVEPLPTTAVAQFSTAAFSPAGLAYDEVSRRFLFGDTDGRRLFVVGEDSRRTVDLVRGDSAGFHDVTALEIGRRGDLWVTSTAADGGAAAIHRLQLISGRTLDTFAVPVDAPVALTDLSVAPNGTVLALDGSGRRVLRLRTGAKAIETAMSLDVAAPMSLTVADNDRAAFVAHASGLARVDLQQRTLRHVSAPAGVALEGLQRIRWHRNSLVAIQRLADGSRALAVLALDRAGTRVTSARVIDPDLERDDRTPHLTIVGDDVYYSAIEPTPTDGTTVDVLVRRIRLP